MVMMKLKPQVIINDWSVNYPDRTFSHPHSPGDKILRGVTRNHPTLGISYLASSKIRMVSIASRVIETINTRYLLGRPDPEWVAFMQDEDLLFGLFVKRHYNGELRT